MTIIDDTISGDGSHFRRLLPLTEKSPAMFDETFRAGAPDSIPDGHTTGLGLAFPGRWICRPLAWTFQLLFWKGKIFYRDEGRLINLILPFRFRAIPAKVFIGESLFDGKPCVVMDYSEGTPGTRMIRDEIREVEPGVYLGLAYAFQRKVIRFALYDESAEPRR